MNLSPRRITSLLSALLILHPDIAMSVETPADSVKVSKTFKEIVVTARESRATSASTIDTTAMKHLQPSSFSDLLELIPGNISRDPDMGSVNMIALRQASNITTSDDYLTSALGTSFIIDGVPINTNSNMNTTPDYSRSGQISVGKGVDMRTISTDDIEKVEIIRGIPSVEYGELTSGLVNIKRKSGISRLSARFKADTRSRLFHVGKGIALTGTWIINTGIDFLDAKIDPRNNRENFKRVTAYLSSNKRWDNQFQSIVWNSSLSYSGTVEHDYNDPDLTVNNTIDRYRSDNHSFKWNNTVTYRPVKQMFLRSADLTAGISYADERLSQQKHVASSRVIPLPVSTSPGSNYIGYLPMLYLADYNVYGKPFTSYTRLSATIRASIGSLINTIKGGIEWNMSKNYGKGAVYDLTRPLVAGNNTRPRAYNDVPAMQQISSYIENRALLSIKRHTVALIAGVRHTQLLNLDHRYALHGKPYFDPRVNATYTVAPIYVRGEALQPEISAGIGWHTKMPVASYLYPDLIYSDFEQLNYYHNVEAYRTLNVMTFIDDVTNYDLKAARNLKWEIRGDISWRGNRLTITYFRENMKNGFRHSGSVFRYQYRRYDASGFDPSAANRPPVIEELPYTEQTYQGVRSQITNGSRTDKRGIEFTFQSRRITALMTRMTINGAYFRTSNNSSQPLWYKPSIVVDNQELQYVGLYDDVDGSVYRSFNTNVMFDTYIPRFNLNFSLTIQNQWFTSRQTIRRDGIPTHYLDPEGVLHVFQVQDSADPYLGQLVRHFNNSSFERLTIPMASYFNIKATKTFWKNRIGIALYVNRLIAIEPDYKRYGLTVRRYSSPYFGMELNIKI